MRLFVFFTLVVTAAHSESIDISPYTKCMSGIIGAIDGKTPQDEKLVANNAEMRARQHVFRYYRDKAEECDYSAMKNANYDSLSTKKNGRPRCHSPVSMNAARQVLKSMIITNLENLAAESKREGVRPNPTTVGAVLNQCSELDDGGNEINSRIKNVRETYGIPMQRNVDRGSNAAG